MDRPLVIGIAGGSASGKSSIAKRLRDAFKDYKRVIRVNEDDYYNDQGHMTMEERLKVNYDHPFAFDHKFLLEHLNDLINGKSIDKPVYDYVNYTRSDKTVHIDGGDVIILEGLFVLEDAKYVSFLISRPL